MAGGCGWEHVEGFFRLFFSELKLAVPHFDIGSKGKRPTRRRAKMKRCQMCGRAMRLDAELVEGQRHYLWHKCMNIKCGAIFLVQERMTEDAPAEHQETLNSATA